MTDTKIKINTKNGPKNAVFIINPVSGVGDGQKRKDKILEIAKELGWHGKAYETSRKINGGTIAKKALANGTRHIIACGGDGTIMEILQAVSKQKAVIGVVPLGTGNLFAKNLKIPTDYKKAIPVALLGKPQKIDIGRANGIFFSIIAGIGLDAELMQNTDRKVKNKLGFFAYIIGGFKSLGSPSGYYKVSIDKKPPKTYKAKSVMIANMGRIESGIEAVPGARADNGILRIGIMQASGILHWIDLAINILRGNINKSPHYKLLSGKEISVVSLRGKKAFQCDGDLFDPVEKLKVEIFPKSLTIMVK